MTVKLTHWSILGAALLVFMSCNSLTIGQETGLLNRDRPAVNLGGWSDEVAFRNWKVQRHAIIGHSRLLDANGHRVTFGSYETCFAAFKDATKDLEPLPKRVVIVMHGLGATP